MILLYERMFLNLNLILNKLERIKSGRQTVNDKKLLPVILYDELRSFFSAQKQYPEVSNVNLDPTCPFKYNSTKMKAGECIVQPLVFLSFDWTLKRTSMSPSPELPT